MFTVEILKNERSDKNVWVVVQVEEVSRRHTSHQLQD